MHAHEDASGIRVTWTHLGADGPAVVRASGRVHEALSAARDGRPRCALVHGSLTVGTTRVEMTPVWGQVHPERAVLAEGPVGARWLGRSRWFRYEVHRWSPHGSPDARSVTSAARALLAALPLVPTPTWGRDPGGTGDMWTSNSVVAWLLVRTGLDPEAHRPPTGLRAPGWAAGLAVAHAAEHGNRHAR